MPSVSSENNTSSSGRQRTSKSGYHRPGSVIIRINLVGKWALDRDNRMLVSVKGVHAPMLLAVDFGPIFCDAFTGAKPNVPEASFIEGVPLVRQVNRDGSYEVAFKPTAFALSRWFGRGKPILDGWQINAYLTSRLHVQSLPEAGVKRLGKKRVLTSKHMSTEFSIVSSFQENSWTKYIWPTRVHFIDQSPGGMFLWISEGDVVAKTGVLLDCDLQPAPQVLPNY